MITALGEPDVEGRIYSFRGTPIGPAMRDVFIVEEIAIAR
jgi:hypothetical protein